MLPCEVDYKRGGQVYISLVGKIPILQDELIHLVQRG